VLLGSGWGELGGSEYLKVIHGLVRGVPPRIDLEAERALQRLLVDLADRRLIRSAHDSSDGGLAVALAECCFDTGGLGADISIESVNASGGHRSRVEALFGESASQVVVSAGSGSVATLLERAAATGVSAKVIGEVGGNRLRISVDGQLGVDVSVAEAEQMWSSAIERSFVKRVA
jgi:phosphoribosylformylglycinamidine synthase